MAKTKSGASAPEDFKPEIREVPKTLRAAFLYGVLAWVLNVLIPVFIGIGFAVMNINWLPNSPLIAQIFFAVAAVLVVIKCAQSAISAEDSKASHRILFALIPSVAVVAFFTWLITIIQIHKNHPFPESASVKQGLVNVDGGSSVGTLNQSGNSFVAADPNSGKAAEIKNSKLGSFTMQDGHACAGIEDWPCFILTEKSYIDQGNREKFDETASSFDGVVKVRLFWHPELADECRKEVEKGVKVLRESFQTKDEKAIEALMDDYPICLMPKAKGQRK